MNTTLQKLSHIPGLDGLRGIAALMVMFFHFNWQPLDISLINKVVVFGQTGVDLFFVLSGFLITRILISTKNQKNYFTNFYIRRALRIFPLYYGFLIVTYFILPLFKIGNTPPFTHQIWYYLYMQNIPATFNTLYSSSPADFWSLGPGHFWSLAVEEHFYLFWPLVVYFLPRIHLIWASLGIILLSLVIRVILVNFDTGVFYFTPCRFDALAIGSLLAYLEYRNKLFVYKKYFLNLGIFSFVLLLISWLFTGAQHLDLVQIIKFPIIAIFYCCVIGYLSIQNSPNFMSRIVGNSFLVFTGKISYGLYVFHPLIYSFTNKSGSFHPIIDLLISLSLTYFIAYISYEKYEKIFLGVKKHFEYT